jgi:TetR/AcrR family transcriptional regulator, regulator of biofilm formation and stress response
MKADGRLSRGTTRKTLLLDVAVRIVAEFGANALTHRAVAKSAQVSLASVTYHFPSSEALRSATYEYAGSRIGQEFARLVLETASNLEAIPDICADFMARLVTDHRINTMTVFEMIVAAGHDPQLSPVTRLLNERLAKLLEPYLGSNAAALTVGAAMQGLVLTALAIDRPNSRKWLRSSVSDLIRRYRIVPSQQAANSSISTQTKQEKHGAVAHANQRARLDDRIRRVNPRRVPR